MTEKQAATLTKRFGEGVYARIWCYADDGNWELSIDAYGESVSFSCIDDVLRSLFDLLHSVRQGKALELWPSRCDAYINPVTFPDLVLLSRCVREMENAVFFIQSVSKERCWMSVPKNIFSLLARIEEQSANPATPEERQPKENPKP